MCMKMPRRLDLFYYVSTIVLNKKECIEDILPWYNTTWEHLEVEKRELEKMY